MRCTSPSSDDIYEVAYDVEAERVVRQARIRSRAGKALLFGRAGSREPAEALCCCLSVRLQRS